MKGDHLGEFEELTLLAVLTLTDRAYGVAVVDVIETQTGREVTVGAAYAALERLERKGLLRSTLGESTGERGGKRRRLFTVTDDGLRLLRESRDAREALWKSLPRSVRSRS